METVKKIAMVAWMVFAIIMAVQTSLTTKIIIDGMGDKITIATDPPTGCEYLIYGAAMTPRLLPNGDQVCGEGEGDP
jgi:hypothetical protein